MATIKKPLLDEDAEIIGKILFPMAPADQATRQGESWLRANMMLDSIGKRKAIETPTEMARKVAMQKEGATAHV